MALFEYYSMTTQVMELGEWRRYAAPTDVEDWSIGGRPNRLAPSRPVAACMKRAQQLGTRALEVAWPFLAPIGRRVLLAAITHTADAPRSQQVLEKVYEDGRQGSLASYRRSLTRCRRDVSYGEFRRRSHDLQQRLTPRRHLCCQLRSDFPSLFADAHATKACLTRGLRHAQCMSTA